MQLFCVWCACVCVRERDILKALLVSGLSPSNWRILTSEAQPWHVSTFNIASALRRMWAAEPIAFIFLQTLSVSRLEMSPEAAKSIIDTHDDADADVVVSGLLELIFRQWEMHELLDRLLCTAYEFLSISEN